MVAPMRKLIWGFALGGSLLLTGCTRDWKFQPYSMWNESRLKPMEASPVFASGSASQSPIPGTIARGEPLPDDPINTGRDASGQLLTKFPFPVNDALLQRGQQRFDIYCSPCHSRMGDGKGMIVSRGFPEPPDYAIQRLRDAPVGHFFDVMTHGYGVMASYASRVTPNDRWAIAAYIRLLQSRRPVVPDVRPMMKRPVGTVTGETTTATNATTGNNS
jgi:mono/diheme cytochrome c family protein